MPLLGVGCGSVAEVEDVGFGVFVDDDDDADDDDGVSAADADDRLHWTPTL